MMHAAVFFHFVVIGLFAASVLADEVYWSGGGTWDTTSQNWGTADGGPYSDAVWSNNPPDSAVFQGTAGTVTLGTAITAGGVTFDTDGYTITGNTLTLGDQGAGSIVVNQSATIDSILDAPGGIVKSGSGNLTLGGVSANTYSGDFSSEGTGALQLNKPANVSAITGDVNLSRGSANNLIYTLADNQFGASSTVNFLGTSGTTYAIMELLGSTQTVAGINSPNNSFQHLITNRQFYSGPATTTDATLVLNGSGTYSYSGILRDTFNNATTGKLHLSKTGTGTQTIGANSLTTNAIVFTGDVTVTAGTLTGTALNAFGLGDAARTVSVSDGGTVEFARTGMYGGHSSTAIPELVIGDGGTVRNTVGNNPLNDVTLSGGTLTASGSTSTTWRSWNINGTITSTGISRIEGGTAPSPGIMLQSAADSSTEVNVVSGSLTISAPIVNGRVNSTTAYASRLVKKGAGTLTLTADNLFTGGTTVDAGTLVINAPVNEVSAIGPGTLVINAGATVLTSRNPFGYNTDSSTPEVVINGGTWDSASHASSFRAVTLNGGTLTRSGAFWYFNQAGRITSTSDSEISGGSMRLRPAGGALMPIDVQSGTLTVTSILANDSGASGFEKLGGGTLLLDAANSYSGGTTVSAGTLALGSGGGLASAAIDVAAGARFDVSALAGGFTVGSNQELRGSGTILGGLLFGADSKLAFTSSLTVDSGTVSFTGFGIDDIVGLDGTLVNEGTYTLLGGTATFDLTGALNVGFDERVAIGGGKEAYFNQGSFQVIVVPEPGGLAAAGVAILSLGLFRRPRLRRG